MPTIHRKKFAGGKYTPQEVHAHLAFPPDARCVCGARPTIRAITMCELAEARKRDDVAQALDQNPMDLVHLIVMLKDSEGKPVPYVRMGKVYACKACGPTLERSLAQAPSHWVVEINRGPEEDKIITS
jgi:hypothetical protein